MKVLAFDFGASSGRAIIGELLKGKLTLTEVHRFENTPVYMNGGLYWDLPRLFHEVKQGILKAKEYGFESIGVDTWGVDYALIGEDGSILSNPFNYRDERTAKSREAVKEIISDEELYLSSGIQVLNINTLFQLIASKNNQPGLYKLSDNFILMPDLFGYLLTGEIYAEKTIASTTQLLDAHTKEWNYPLIEKLGLKKEMFPKLVNAGTVIGTLREELAAELETERKAVIAVAGHDTASAVAAVPAEAEDFIYISCGTWSLFGTELSEPCISKKSAELSVSNETGYNDTTRFLKNIIGLWMIQETRRQFIREGKEYSYADMERLAKEAKPFAGFIDPDEPRFTPPGNQLKRIREYLKETGQNEPASDGEIIRIIYESLAMKYKYTVNSIKECTGKDFKAIHMVGGGIKDGFLCQLTADATGMEVIAGPAEATAAGNIAVQLIALGEIKDISEARKIIRDSFDTKVYKPQNNGFDNEYEKYIKVTGGN